MDGGAEATFSNIEGTLVWGGERLNLNLYNWLRGRCLKESRSGGLRWQSYWRDSPGRTMGAPSTSSGCGWAQGTNQLAGVISSGAA